MVIETFGWLLAFIVAACFIVAFAVPASRPYAKKYWWTAIIFMAIAAAMIFLRRKPGRDLGDSSEDREEGEEIAAETIAALDKVVDYARAEQAKVDVELEMNKLESSKDREVFQAKIDTASAIDDSLERRRALIRVAKEQETDEATGEKA